VEYGDSGPGAATAQPPKTVDEGGSVPDTCGETQDADVLINDTVVRNSRGIIIYVWKFVKGLTLNEIMKSIAGDFATLKHI